MVALKQSAITKLLLRVFIQINEISSSRIKNSLTDILVALGAEDETVKEVGDIYEEEEKKDEEKPERKCEALIVIATLITSSLRSEHIHILHY